MKVIWMPRMAGKTTQIVEWLRADPHNKDINGMPMVHTRCMIVATEQDKKRILKQFPDLKYQQVETWHTIREGYYRPVRDRMEFMIDDLDRILAMMEPIRIVGFSITQEAHDGEQ